MKLLESCCFLSFIQSFNFGPDAAPISSPANKSVCGVWAPPAFFKEAAHRLFLGIGRTLRGTELNFALFIIMRHLRFLSENEKKPGPRIEAPTCARCCFNYMFCSVCCDTVCEVLRRSSKSGTSDRICIRMLSIDFSCS